MKFIKYAIALVIAIVTIPMLVSTVYGLTQPQDIITIVDIEYSGSGTERSIDSVTYNNGTPLAYEDFYAMFEYELVGNVNHVTNYVSIYDDTTLIYTLNHGLIQEDYLTITSDLLVMGMNLDFYTLTSNEIYLDILGGLITDYDEILSSNDHLYLHIVTDEIPPIILGTVGIILSLIPLVFIAGILYFAYMREDSIE
jgi:hypothetical protein